MDDSNNGDKPKVQIPRWNDGFIPAIYEEALRVTRQLDPDATKPMNAIFTGMVAALYQPRPQPIQVAPGRVVPVQDFLGRGH